MVRLLLHLFLELCLEVHVGLLKQFDSLMMQEIGLKKISIDLNEMVLIY